MEPSYSVLADALSKFHTSSEWIQALWLVVVPATIVGVTACVMRAVREIAALFSRRGQWQGHPVYAIRRAADGRWMLYAQGAVRGEDEGGMDRQDRARPLSPPP